MDPSAAAPHGNFNFPTGYRIGAGRVFELPEVCALAGVRRPLVVTDPGIMGLDWFGPVLEGIGLPLALFAAVDPNPEAAIVDAGVVVANDHEADGVILLGGGSALDVGKCIALLARNPGSVFDYEDVGDNWKRADPDKILPSIAIPTTAGTGSEVGRASVIVDPSDHGKKIIFHPKMQPVQVIADPYLTFGLPPIMTAATGMDALAHCFEAYCAPGYHPMADGIALEGMRLIKENLLVAYAQGTNVVARTHMMMAASMGATAFQKGLGLIHALSHPLGGLTGIHHGTANAIFLPYVMVHNRPVIEARMERLARFLELPVGGFDAVLKWMLDLRTQLGLPHTLKGVLKHDATRAVATMAATDPSLATNPKPCSLDEMSRVLGKAIEGDLSP